MADADYDDFDAYGDSRRARRAPVAPGRGTQRLVNIAGALTSVALVAGLGVWGYKLAVRDVRGVPVIQALEGPARIAPDNPGGELALHQGLAVNEIAADGEAGDPADRLTLAPRPDELSEEDSAMGVMNASLEEGTPDPGAGGSDFAGSSVVQEDTLLATLRPDEPLPDGPADPLLPGLTAPDAGMELPPSAEAIPAEVPGVSKSVRPMLRPGSEAAPGQEGADYDAVAEAAAAAVAVAMSPDAVDLAPAGIPAGTRLVQIGSYPDESQARLEWDKAIARFGPLMTGKRRVIEEAASGGQAFYRLRVEGFADVEESRRFCATLKAEGAECVPTVVR